ncbi:MAG: class 1 fructose-bisphosphatase [Nitrospirota bacterium]|nr:class 1 fructose-bisphosphatase [Nitrospirota bacterium]
MTLTTIERHIVEEERRHGLTSGTLTNLLYDIAVAAKVISREVRRAGLTNIIGSTGDVNVQGETVQKLDIYANDLLSGYLAKSGRVCAIGSEELAKPIMVPEKQAGKYVVNLDPLDGSGNIAVNASIGTIFSILPKLGQGAATEADCLQPGRNQVAAGYVMYGSSTVFVYSTGLGVYGFTLDPTVGEFVLSHSRIRYPGHCKFYSINEGYASYWDEPTRRYIEWVKGIDPASHRPYGHRYIGAMVADFHRNMLEGGVFLYPRDNKDPQKTTGKLRLLFEANPMAFLAEQAGGAATTGTERILTITPTDLHQRVPVIVGMASEVERYENFVRQSH